MTRQQINIIIPALLRNHDIKPDASIGTIANVVLSELQLLKEMVEEVLADDYVNDVKQFLKQ